MAQKRMFDRAIIETDAFLNVSLTAKALYFLLGMECDDEGFVSPTRVLRLYGGEAGDIKNLMDVGLIIRFESGVIVITDWHQNNYLDKARIKPTQYLEEKKMLGLTEGKRYVFNNCLTTVDPEERRIEENRVEEKIISSPDGDGSMVYSKQFLSFWEAFPKKVGKGNAWRSWNKIKGVNSIASKILESVEEHKAKDLQWKKDDGQFIPHPATFLNQRRWEDELEVATLKEKVTRI